MTVPLQSSSTVRLRILFVIATLVASVLATTGHAGAGAFPGNNGRIVFQRYVDTGYAINSTFHIYAMDPDGSDKVDLSGRAADFDLSPSLSADGSKVAFVRRDGSGGDDYDVWTMNADGSGQRNLTRETGLSPEHPTWNPAGTRILFSASTQNGNNSELFTIHPDGSNLLRITSTPVTDPGGAEAQPTWSADGTRIAFIEEYACGGGRGVFVMDANGSNRSEVTAEVRADLGCIEHPTWSPNGEQLAFLSQGVIHIIGAGGGGTTEFDTATRTFTGLAWSPDGNKLVFGDEEGDLSMIRVNGAGEHKVAAGPMTDSVPDWGRAMNVIRDTEGLDQLVGTPGPDIIFGGSGNDVVDGRGGNDIVYGGPGNDIVDGGAGDDSLVGADGRDRLVGSSDNDSLDGGADDDRLLGGSGDDDHLGGGGDDDATGGPGRDHARGDAGDDHFLFEDGTRDHVAGGPGTDEADVDGIDVVIGVEHEH